MGYDKISCTMPKMDNEIDIQSPKVRYSRTARNVLENGISKNIWYEEYVPYHSLFFVCVNCEDDDLLNKFDAAVDNEIVQFGGNATIGYGLTRIKSLAKGGDKNG